MKHILGLDLGPNSIGWTVIEVGKEESEDTLFTNGKILQAGSRIIPIDADTLNNYEKGNSKSQTAVRTAFRSVRRMNERFKLRRERLNRVLTILDYLPEHYKKSLNRYGQIESDKIRIAWQSGIDGHNEFLFKDSFKEMVALFKKNNKDNCPIPYDWTLYYLRHKALTQAVTCEEMAWILHSFNQKRGYNQTRSDESAENNKEEEYYALKVVDIKATDEKKGRNTIYRITFENGMVYPYPAKDKPDWMGKVKEFIVTERLTKNGDKKLSFRVPKEEDWQLIKTRTEDNIIKSHQTVGSYIWNSLLNEPSQKVRGKLISTIDRHYYKDELKAILQAQAVFHPELKDATLYSKCIEALYPSNEAYRNSIKDKNFIYLFTEDIIFYQRPLKTKKSLIATCPFEYHMYFQNGIKERAGVRCVARSNPLFQEFRLWQFISNLRICKRFVADGEHITTDKDVTDEYLHSEEAYVSLFDWLRVRKDVNQKSLLRFLKLDEKNYRWNYPEDKTYPASETRALMFQSLKKAEVPFSFLTSDREKQLWHLLFSIKTKEELKSALTKFADRNNLENTRFVQEFTDIQPFTAEYGGFSEKALKKLLPLMRLGKYWKKENIDASTFDRIDKLLTGEWDPDISERVRDKVLAFTQIDDFKGLPFWLACYVVYGRFTEAGDIIKWKSPDDIDSYLTQLKQYSLRNPIVEQVVTEALRVVRDIWRKVGTIDEIHVELGRDLKQTAQKRAETLRRMNDNENTNLRIRALLTEFQNPEFGIENVRPYSPSQQEALHIFEDYVLLTNSNNMPEDIMEILRRFRETEQTKRPSHNDIMRYKLWLEQKYTSPYTGNVIPLSKLFTSSYQIDHVIPQARYYDNSYNNKVICESEVNHLKSNRLGFEFIKNERGRVVICTGGKAVTILEPAEYVDLIKNHYAQNKRKLQNLLSEDIPETFTQRQMNDTRYISKFILGLLSNIVREKMPDGHYEQEYLSKNVVVCNGAITDRLKQDWSMNDVWNHIIYPRFERLNVLCKEKNQPLTFGQWTSKQGKRVFQIEMPLALQKGFNKKRIDHRHHAMDAITIACATRSIVNYLNNESSHKNETVRHDFRRRLCRKLRLDNRGNYTWVIKKPWNTFTQDAEQQLRNIVVSFKKNTRVLTKTTNYYLKYDSDIHKIRSFRQTQGEHLAIRKSLHKDTVFGKVNLRKIKDVRLAIALKTPLQIVDKALKKKVLELLSLNGYGIKLIEKYFKDNQDAWKHLNLKKIKVYYFTDESEKMVATRKPLDETFTEKKIETISDTGIQKILKNHLYNNGNDVKKAFSPDGIDYMNAHLKELNDGHSHQPILRVRVCEPLGLKFPVGCTGNKHSKYVESDKGTNLFYAVYGDENGKRVGESIPLNTVIENLKQCNTAVPERNEQGLNLLFSVSPNDLVYVPTEEELASHSIDSSAIDTSRIYKMVSSSQERIFFVPYFIAKGIVDTLELGPNNKNERTWSGEIIRNIFIPVKINRIGDYEINTKFLPMPENS